MVGVKVKKCIFNFIAYAQCTHKPRFAKLSLVDCQMSDKMVFSFVLLISEKWSCSPDPTTNLELQILCKKFFEFVVKKLPYHLLDGMFMDKVKN